MQDTLDCIVHRFNVKDTHFALTGVLCYNGSNHYYSIVQDTNEQWWYCNGLGEMWLCGSWETARQRSNRGPYGLYPTTFFYAAVRTA